VGSPTSVGANSNANTGTKTKFLMNPHHASGCRQPQVEPYFAISNTAWILKFNITHRVGPGESVPGSGATSVMNEIKSCPPKKRAAATQARCVGMAQDSGKGLPDADQQTPASGYGRPGAQAQRLSTQLRRSKSILAHYLPTGPVPPAVPNKIGPSPSAAPVWSVIGAGIFLTV